MVTTAVSSLRAMAWFLLLIAHKHACWLGGSTAGPSHSETWRGSGFRSAKAYWYFAKA